MVKKVIYGGVWSLLSAETILVGSKFYELYKTGAVLTFAGGYVVAPYWLIVEGTMIGIAPIITRYIIRALKNDEITDDSNLSALIKKYNKRKEDK